LALEGGEAFSRRALLTDSVNSHFLANEASKMKDAIKEGPRAKESRPDLSKAPIPEAPPQRAPQVEVNDKDIVCLYANFCRVTGTPEELILDFGLNAQPFGVPTAPIEVKQRIVTNYFTAKRMLQALLMSVQRHEQAFGVLETDVQKRVVAGGGARG
jgi:hypothetical protein